MMNDEFKTLSNLAEDFAKSRIRRATRRSTGIWLVVLTVLLFNAAVVWMGASCGLFHRQGKAAYWRCIRNGHLLGILGAFLGAGSFIGFAARARGVGSLVNAVGTGDAGTNAAESAADIRTLLGFVLCMSLGFSMLAVVDAGPKNASPGLFWCRLVGTIAGAIIATAVIVPIYHIWRKQFR